MYYFIFSLCDVISFNIFSKTSNNEINYKVRNLELLSKLKFTLHRISNESVTKYNF